MRPTILLTETLRLPSIALLALDFANAGIKVSAVCPSRHPLMKTHAAEKTFRYSGCRPLASLVAAIDATRPHIVIPCDDRAVQHLHELHGRACRQGAAGRSLVALIENSLGLAEGYAIVSSRYGLLRVARELGLLVPDVTPIDTADDLKQWQQRQPFPWVLKADGTFGGHGVKIAHTLEQAVEFVSRLSQFYTGGRAVKRLLVNRDAFWLRPWWNGSRPAISVQSYIHGRPANCAALCWKGKVLALIGVEVVGAAGETGSACVVRVVDNASMKLCAERIAHRLNLSGFFGLDFMIEDATGLAYLIEMNPRPTRLSHLRLGKGRDLIGALCSEVLGQPFEETLPVTQNAMIAYFPDAWDCQSEFLEACFHDVPSAEPDLMQELRRPWPTGSWLWRLFDQLGRLKGNSPLSQQ